MPSPLLHLIRSSQIKRESKLRKLNFRCTHRRRQGALVVSRWRPGQPQGRKNTLEDITKNKFKTACQHGCHQSMANPHAQRRGIRPPDWCQSCGIRTNPTEKYCTLPRLRICQRHYGADSTSQHYKTSRKTLNQGSYIPKLSQIHGVNFSQLQNERDPS